MINKILLSLKHVLNRLIGKSFLLPDSKSGLWLDWTSDSEIEKRLYSEELAQFKKDGFVILPKLIPDQLCERLNSEFNEFIQSDSERASAAVDANGLHSRLCNFHMLSSSAKEIAFHEKLMKIIDEIFDSEAILCTSLYFEKGSEQRIHRDGPFFYTNPRNMFVGVWVALEDIREGTGELLYYPQGHNIPILVSDIIRMGGGWNEYSKRIESECIENKIPLRKNHAKKGDVLIWHAELPHGGSPIKNPALSRKSIVFHFKAKSATIHGEEAFFGREPVAKFDVFQYAKFHSRSFIDQGMPFFAKNEY